MPDQHHEDDTTQATARLPGLEIEIVHRRLPGGDAEQISINLQAVPSTERVPLTIPSPYDFATMTMTMGMMNMRAAATKTTPTAVHVWVHKNAATRAMTIPAAMPATPAIMATCAVFGFLLFPLGSLSPCGARALFMNHLPFRLRLRVTRHSLLRNQL